MNSIRQIVEQTTQPFDPKASLEALVAWMHSNNFEYRESVKHFKRAYVENLLRLNRGNCCKTAVQLGMHRNTFDYLRRELKIDARNFRPKHVLDQRFLPSGAREREDGLYLRRVGK